MNAIYLCQAPGANLQNCQYANSIIMHLCLSILKFGIFDLVSYLANCLLKRGGNLWPCS